MFDWWIGFRDILRGHKTSMIHDCLVLKPIEYMRQWSILGAKIHTKYMWIDICFKFQVWTFFLKRTVKNDRKFTLLNLVVQLNMRLLCTVKEPYDLFSRGISDSWLLLKPQFVVKPSYSRHVDATMMVITADGPFALPFLTQPREVTVC